MRSVYHLRSLLPRKARQATFILPCLLCGILLSSTQALADNSLKPGQEALRHHLQYLADHGILDELTTTWPIQTDSFAQQIQAIDPLALSSAERRSYEKLLEHISPSSDSFRFAAFAQYGASREALRGFFDDSRENNELRLSLGGRSTRFKGNLSIALVDSPQDGQSYRWDGSNLSTSLGQWEIGAGRVDRWWGPGWQSSLILSHNARPSPGLFIQRGLSRASDLPLLKHLGPWSLSVFANQLESNRYVPKAKLLGARFAFKPLPAIELGLSRSAQWGGQGRPQSFENLLKLILGHDNVGTDGIELDGSNEPGNQLGGIDFRWNTALADHKFALYGQLIGEDESGGLPSRNIGLLGLETALITASTHGRIFIEASDTSMRFYSDPLFNATYNHHIYQDGYRYHGQSIGASSDNDSRLLTLGGYHRYKDWGSLSWKAIHGDLNRDSVYGRNSVAPERSSLEMIYIEATKELSQFASLSLIAHHITEPIEPGSDLSRSSLKLRVNLSQNWE